MLIHARLRIFGVDRPHPEQTLDAADHAANGAAHDRADRPRRVVADIGAMRDAVGNALRLRRERRCEYCGGAAANKIWNFTLHPLSCVETAAA